MEKNLNQRQLVLSSDNINKIKEIKNILKDLPITILSKKDVGCGNLEVDEKFDTLEENARIKAEEIKKYTKASVIADDTGLFVEELKLEPGVHSARYSGDHDDKANREKLLEKLKNKQNRKAYFKTVIVYISEDNEKKIFEGVCKGSISHKERGENGFGYDSIFIPEGYEKTFAEMADSQKNEISHRKRALENLANYLRNIE